MTIDRIAGPPAMNVAFAQTTARPTPTPDRPSVSFAAVMAAVGSTLAKGASAAVSVLPGGSQIAAATRGAATPMVSGAAAGPLGGGLSPQGPTLSGGGVSLGSGVIGSSGTTGTGGLVSTGDPVADMQAQQLQLINLQVQIQSSSQQFSTMSNVLNAEHQAAMGAIQNIRV